MTIILQKILTF